MKKKVQEMVNNDVKSSDLDEFIEEQLMTIDRSISQTKFPESADNHLKWMNLLDKLDSAELFETYIMCTNLLGFPEDINCFNFVKFLARDLSNYHQSESFLWVGKKFEVKMIVNHVESLYNILDWMMAEVLEHRRNESNKHH